MKNKSEKNKTIDISLEDGKEYLNLCIKDTEELYSIPSNSVIIGDSLDILPKIEKCSIDCIILDPPYNLTKNYHGNIFNKIKADNYKDYTKKLLNLVKPLLKTTGSLFVCYDWQTSLIACDIIAEEFNIKNRITWQREKGRGSRHNFKNTHEDIWFCTLGNEYKFYSDRIKHRRPVIAPYKDSNGLPKDWISSDKKYRDTYASNFWDDISIPFWSMKENTEHPTQKAEKLIAKLILATTDVGDTVLDPFGGSGTTACVCKKLKRNYISIEQNELYCVWTQVRLKMAEEDSSIQGYDGNVFFSRSWK